MDLTINGNYAPYVNIVLLKFMLFFLQRLNHVRAHSASRGASVTANIVIDLYFGLSAIVANLLSWGTWALCIWVGIKFGIVVGLLLFTVGLFGSIVLVWMAPSGLAFDVIGHVVSLLTTPYLCIFIARRLSLV